MSDKFDVFLTGQLAGDKALADVINNLAVLFKIPQERASALLSQAPVVVKGSIDSATCEKYRIAIERTGARCRIERVPHLELDVDTPHVAAPKPMAPSVTAPALAPAPARPPLPKSQKPTVEPTPAVPLSTRIPAQEASRPAFLFADESIRFEGSVVRQAVTSFRDLIKASTGRVPLNFYCFITNRRLLLFSGDKLFLELRSSEIQSITKGRLGSTISHGADETTLTFTDKPRGEAALARLKEPSLGDMPPPVAQENLQPPSVGGGWLIALSPLVGDLINLILMAFFNIRVIMLWYAVSAVFALSDEQKMQQKGHNTRTNGIGNPYNVPSYLFARARVFGHGKSYSIIGAGFFAIELILEIMYFYDRFTS